MKMLSAVRSFAIPLAMLILLSPIAGSVAAVTHDFVEPIQVFALSQQDLDGDGLPDVTIIDSAFATEQDRVLVYDRNSDMQAGSRWEEMTDFDDDVWVFDVGADGTAQLIIAFALEDGNQVAYFYVDENQDGQVSYEVAGKDVQITESPHWRVKVVAQGAWLLPDGRQNPHLTILVDGTTRRLLESYVPLTKGWLDWSADGMVDWEIESGDRDADGQADYLLTRLMTEVPDYFNAFRTSLYVDENPRRTLPYTNAVFWPFLVGVQRDDAARYFDRPPVIAIDWETGVIERAGISGYPAEQGYHILSSAPTWQKGRVNDVLHENPLAYYNMANDQDNWPELLIRVVHPIWLNVVPNQPIPADMLHVEYTWDQNNDGLWDYEVSGAGRKPITETIDFPDFAVRTVPYEKLPSWAISQKWDAAFFVVGEAGGRGDSESLWIWDFAAAPPNDLKATYLSGYSDTPPPGAFHDIQAGYRGEYSLEYDRQPLLYFSPADQRLHLVEAQGGVWNLGDEHLLRYANLDGDAYLDRWQEERDGTVVQQLNYSDGVYVVSGNGDVQVKQTDVGPALFETQPPKNHEEWQRLDEQLKANQTAASPEDFTGMLGQLPGPVMQISEATARDYRLTPHGFRFILELRSGFSVTPDQETLIPLPEAPGTYVVSYAGGAWSVQPATPAVLRVSDVKLEAPGGAPHALRWSMLEVLLRNEGLEDVHDLPVCVTFDDRVGRQVVMTDTVALLPGEGQQSVVWDWAPAAPGPWQVRIAAYCSGSEDAISDGDLLGEAVVQVTDTGKPSVPWLTSLGGRIPGSIALFLFVTVALAGAAAAVWAKRLGL